ncbi:MAG: helix-turn-helix domain-containing protein [Acidimicrobiia bacterium]
MSNERLTLTVEETAELLGISRAFAYTLVKNEELPFVRLGRRVVVPRRALERLLDAEFNPSGGQDEAPTK